MKITKSQLKQIIKEELGKVLNEAETEAEFARHQGGLHGGSKRPVDVSGRVSQEKTDEIGMAFLELVKEKLEEEGMDWVTEDGAFGGGLEWENISQPPLNHLNDLRRDVDKFLKHEHVYPEGLDGLDTDTNLWKWPKS